jgi:hypothetical protein
MESLYVVVHYPGVVAPRFYAVVAKDPLEASVKAVGEAPEGRVETERIDKGVFRYS